MRPQNRDQRLANSNQILGRCKALKLIINEHFPLSSKTTKAKLDAEKLALKKRTKVTPMKDPSSATATPTRARDTKDASSTKEPPEEHTKMTTKGKQGTAIGVEELKEMINKTPTGLESDVGKELATAIQRTRGPTEGQPKR